MSRVRSARNRSTEWKLRAALVRNGVAGWTVTARQLPGSPDFLFPDNKLAVFVDGCFWHGCPRCYRRPKSNRKFWDEKIQQNRKRDRKVTSHLRRTGWRVIRVWEHDLQKTSAGIVRRIQTVLSAVKAQCIF